MAKAMRFNMPHRASTSRSSSAPLSLVRRPPSKATSSLLPDMLAMGTVRCLSCVFKVVFLQVLLLIGYLRNHMIIQ